MSRKRVGLLALIAAASMLLVGANVFAQPPGGGPPGGQPPGGGPPSEPPGLARVAEILADRNVNWRDPQERARAAERIREVEVANLKRARQRAAAMGIPMRREEPDGRVTEIVGLDENDDFLIYTTHNADAAISSGANLLQEAPFNLDGSGLTVGVWDENRPRTSHQEFESRLTVRDGAEGISAHHTHVSATVGAAGIHPPARGMAPNVLIDAYNWISDTSEMTTAAATGPGQPDKLYVSNHSYGLTVGWRRLGDIWVWNGTGTDQNASEHRFGQYNSTARNWDSVAYNAPYYLIFRSAGNNNNNNPSFGDDIRIDDVDYTYDPSIHPPGDGVNNFHNIAGAANSKNVVVVGAANNAVLDGERHPAHSTITSFSSRGPTDDGRIKPDIVANGLSVLSAGSGADDQYASQSGTSMSSPSAAGSAVLLVQLYRDLFSGGAMWASTLKGLIIHTATDLGEHGLGNVGPDYQYGWGLINVHKAAELLMDHYLYASKNRIREDSLSTSVPERVYEFEWDGESPIRATLSWTDPPGSSTTAHNSRTSRLVNDLDLKIIAPDGTEYLPWVMPFVVSDDPNIQWQVAGKSEPAITGTNSTDNVEQVLINDPAQEGTWQIEITHKGSLTNGEQAYSLLLSGVAEDPDLLVFHSVSPHEAQVSTVVTVDITGSALSADTAIKLQKAGEPDIPGTFVEMIGDTLRCTFNLSDAALGKWDVVATNPDEQTFTLSDVFTVTPFTTVLFEEDFEGSSSLPAGWSQEQLVGSGASWKVQTGGRTGTSNPTTAYSGTNNVTLYMPNRSDNIVRLYTPTMNLSEYEDVVLRFAHHMRHWDDDQDELRVFYSTNGGSSWTLLEEYTTSVMSWTLRELPLPSPGANYMIAFEGNALYGFGVVIDDVEVIAYGEPEPTPPHLSVTPADSLSSSGIVGGPFDPAEQVYTLTNTGSDPMDWEVSKSESWVSLSSPTSGTLEPGHFTTVTVSINSTADSLSNGTYSDIVSFINTTNGEGNDTRTVDLLIQETYTITYDGNNHTSGEVPEPQTKLENVDLTLASNTGGLERTGYTFTGWNTAADGSGVDYEEGAVYTTDADLTLYANWNSPPEVDAGPDQFVFMSESVPWTPEQVEHLAAWFDAMDESTLDIVDGKVRGWDDKSGNENHAEQSNAALRPPFNAEDSDFNYLPTVGRTGGNTDLTFLQTTSSFGLRNAYIVTYYDNATFSNHRVLLSQNTNHARVQGTSAGTTWNNNSFAMFRDGSESWTSDALPMEPTLWKARASSTIDSEWRLLGGANSWQYWDHGAAGEFIITDGEEDTETAQQLEGYLAHKWGLVDNLPSDHPYKEVAPGAPNAVVTLNGSALDPEQDPLTIQWSKIDGPDALVVFIDPSDPETTVTFFAEGVYTLRLTADDGLHQTQDDVVVTVAEPAQTYTVTYDANDATGGDVPVDSSVYDPGDTVTVLGNTGSLVRSGYEFDGWNTQADGNGTSYAENDTFDISASTTLYVQWTPNTYTVTLDPDGGTGGTDSVEVTFGSAMPPATAPTHDDYTFAGYFTEANGAGTQYYDAEMSSVRNWDIDADKTLYAWWNSPPEVDAGPDQTVYLTESVAWTPAQITTVAAWYDAADESTITEVGSNKVSQWNDKSGNERHLIQNTDSKRPAYTATLNDLKGVTFTAANNQELGDTAFAVDTDELTIVALFKYNTVAPGPRVLSLRRNTTDEGLLHISTWNGGDRAGYRYPENSSVSGNDADTDVRILSYTTSGTQDQNLYMNGSFLNDQTSTIETFISEQLYFGSQGGEQYCDTDLYEVIILPQVSDSDRQRLEGYLAHKWGMADDLPSDHPYKDAAPGSPTAVATLDGSATDPDNNPLTTAWSKESGPAAVTFADASVTNTTATFTTNGIYTLRLSADNGFLQSHDEVVITVAVAGETYSVTYDANGATGGDVPEDLDSPYDPEALVTVLGPGDLEKTGYAFSGWNTVADGTGTSYDPDDTFTITSNTTLYAQWSLNEYTVTFQPGTHGSLAGGDPNVVYDVGHGSDAPEAPTVNPNTGYTFTGWNPEIPATITDDFTTTAQYELKTYTVSFVTDGTLGASLTGNTNQVVSHGGSTDVVTASAPADHQFVSWTLADVVYTLDTEVIVTDVTEDQTLVANFVPNDVITITAASAEKVYDGLPLMTNDYSYVGDLEEGHTLVSVEVTGSQTLVGESANVATNAVIQDAELNDVTDTYTITYLNGALTVTPRPLTITADDAEKVYDGEALTNSGYEITEGSLADGDSLDAVTVIGSRTDVGESANVPSDAVITNDSDENVTASYDITYANGTLTVTKAESSITVTGDTSYAYTGDGLGPDNADVDGSMGDVTFSYEGTSDTSYGPSAEKPIAVGTYEVVATVDADANHFGAQSDAFAFEIIRATPTVTDWPVASDITLGDALSTSTLSGGEASVDGTFAFTNPETVPDAGGVYSASVTFTPDEPENYTDVVGSVDVYVDASVVLPFEDDFEALDLGDLDGQNGWEAAGAVVQTNVVKSGEQAAAITDGDGYVRRTFVDAQTNVWTDFHYQPVFFDDPPSAIDPDATAVLYFNDDGHPVVYDGQEPEVIASYTATGQWMRVTIEHDYDEKVWDLYLDGISSRTGLAFYNAGSTHYEELHVSGAGSAIAYLDDIQILLTSPLEDLIYYTLTVLSAHGDPLPEVGESTYPADTLIEASVAGSPDITEEDVKYEVTGWEGTGSGLTSGPGTNMSFNITEDTTLTWQWSTNYWVELIVEGE